jgi:hypothetical protein
MILTVFIYFDKNFWNNAPNRDQHTVDTKPVKARRIENSMSEAVLL